jgi:hypothetical protein
MAEPEETYSTSEHLYTELDIPREATGMLPRAMRDRAGLEAEAIEDIGETGKIRTPRRGSAARGSGGRGGRAKTSAADGAAQTGGAAGRRRRRTRAGQEIGTDTGAGPGTGTGTGSGAGAAAAPSAADLRAHRKSVRGNPSQGLLTRVSSSRAEPA